MAHSSQSLTTSFALVALIASCGSPSSGTELRSATTTAAMPNPSGQKAFVRTPQNTDASAVSRVISSAEVGSTAPDFELRDAAGRMFRLSQFRGKLVVLEWFDPECPFVTYAYDDGPLSEMETRYAASGIVWLSLYSTRADRASLAPAIVREFASRRKLRAPILIDTEGTVAKTFGARTTPHMFLVNERGVLVYSGALDNAPMGRVERAAAKTNYVERAVDDLRSGHAVTTSSTRPYGSPLTYPRP